MKNKHHFDQWFIDFCKNAGRLVTSREIHNASYRSRSFVSTRLAYLCARGDLVQGERAKVNVQMYDTFAHPDFVKTEAVDHFPLSQVWPNARIVLPKGKQHIYRRFSNEHDEAA